MADPVEVEGAAAPRPFVVTADEPAARATRAEQRLVLQQEGLDPDSHGDEQYTSTLFSSTYKDIYNVLKGVVEGGADIDLTVPMIPVSNSNNNLFLLKGSVNLSLYENLLVSAYGQAAAGQQNGYFVTSAIDRFLRPVALQDAPSWVMEREGVPI